MTHHRRAGTSTVSLHKKNSCYLIGKVSGKQVEWGHANKSKLLHRCQMTKAEQLACKSASTKLVSLHAAVLPSGTQSVAVEFWDTAKVPHAGRRFRACRACCRVSKRNAPSPLQSVNTGMVTDSTFLTRQNLQVASRGVLAAPQGSPNRSALLQKSPTAHP